MAATSNPKLNLSLSPAQLAVATAERNDLIVGTMPAVATAVSGQLYTDVGAKTKSELDNLFGVNSDLRNRIQQFINSNGGYSQLAVIAVDEDGGAVKAEGDITPTGTATEDGEIVVKLVDENQFKKTISISNGDTAAEVAQAITAAFAAANFPTMPVVVADAITPDRSVITAVDGGTIGNNYKIVVEGSVAGLTFAVTDMASGATNPTVTTILDNVGSTRFTGVNWPTAWEDQVDVVKDFLDDRFNSDNAILDGVAFVGWLDTFANAKAKGEAHNSQSLVYMGNTANVFQPADWTAAYFQGVRARRLTQDAPISDYIVTLAGLLDLFGGPGLASLPYFNTPLDDLAVVEPNDLYDNLEQSELEAAGFSTYGVNVSQNQMITGVMVTTWTEDAAGNPNESFQYLNYVDTSSICREYMFNNLKARFSQSRLTEGDLVADRSMENEESIRTEFKKIYKQLAELALTQKGSVPEEFFNQNLKITINLAGRSVTATTKLPIVTQLGEMIVGIQLNFSLEG